MIIGYIVSLTIFFVFLFLLFQILKFLLYCLYIWQLAEYRLDRFKVRLINPGDRKELCGYLNLLNFYLPNKYPQITFRTFITILLLIFIIYQLLFIIYRPLVKLIPLEDKFIVTLFLVILIIYYLIPALVLLLTIIINICLKPAKKTVILFAQKKIKKHKNLLIIGITGSYGKSLTKEIISECLALKYKVLKTPANYNTEIGIAKTILFSLKREHQIFVAEMGAYKPGEIDRICALVKPKIGIITGINEQHLGLFQTLKNTIRAKHELIENLPRAGLALFNAQNKHTKRLFKKKKTCRFLLYGDKSREFEESLAAARLIGRYLKIPAKRIKKIIPKLKKFIQLKRKTGRKGILVIDDSYSSNYHGFKKAIKLIEKEKRKKIVITPGIIELGEASGRIHKDLGRELVKTADKIIITNENFASQFKSGINKEDQKKILVSNQELQILSCLKGCFNRNWLVLWEGRIPLNIKKLFLNKKR